jgi:hypothetical protein
MGDIIIKGKNGERIRKKYHVSYDPARGTVVTESFESAGGAETWGSLLSLFHEYQNRFIACEMDCGQDISRITARINGSVGGTITAAACDTWQLLGNEIQKDIRELPASLALITDTPDTWAQIKKDLIKAEAGGTISTLTSASNWLFKLLIKGTTHFAVGQHVLRHTANIPDDWATPIFDNGVNCIYTTAGLLGEISNGWVRNCPIRIRSKISALTAPTNVAGYLWGWRKLPSTETTAGDNRIDVSQEYWLEQWSTDIYSPA